MLNIKNLLMNSLIGAFHCLALCYGLCKCALSLYDDVVYVSFVGILCSKVDFVFYLFRNTVFIGF